MLEQTHKTCIPFMPQIKTPSFIQPGSFHSIPQVGHIAKYKFQLHSQPLSFASVQLFFAYTLA